MFQNKMDKTPISFNKSKRTLYSGNQINSGGEPCENYGMTY